MCSHRCYPENDDRDETVKRPHHLQQQHQQQELSIVIGKCLHHPPQNNNNNDETPFPPISTNGRQHIIAVAASVTLFWLMVSLIPIYNKYFFQREYYPYPIATAGIQLGCVSVLLAILNSAQHYFFTHGRCNNNKSSSLGNNEEQFATEHYLHESETNRTSWIFGPHFLWKLRAIFPIGFLFGVKYGVTNLGLHLIPAPTHLLLQSTDLIWTVLGAWYINGERSSQVGMACLCGCILGSLLLSIQVGQNASAPVLAIAVNLLSPMLLGLCISTLRSACVELMSKDNRVGGSVSAVELTAIKLCISSVVALLLAMIFEGSTKNDSNEAPTITDNYENIVLGWLDAFHNLPAPIKWGVLGGSLPILIFQVNCTFLTHLTSSVSVGLVGQLKIIPQWITATIFTSDVHFRYLSSLNLAGAVLTMASAAAFALNEYFEHSSRVHIQKISSSENDDLLYCNEEDNNTSSSDTEGESSALLMGDVKTLDDASPRYGSTNVTTATKDECTMLENV